jgi:hypothetical protein
MLEGLTALMVPDVPGLAVGAAVGAAPCEAAAVEPGVVELPLLPQAAASTTTPKATAGTCSHRARFAWTLRKSSVGTFTVDSLSRGGLGFMNQSPRRASMGARRAARLAG